MNWYALQLKLWYRKKVCWLQVIAMCLLIIVFSTIKIPQTDNLRIGVSHIQGNSAERIVDILIQNESIFDFVEYADEDIMRKDILAGRLECGFAFAENLDQKMESGDITGSVKYYETPFLTKGKVARETFFSSFLQVYGEQILKDSIEDIYDNYDAEVEKELLKRNAEYIGSEKVFQIQVESVEVQQNMESEQHNVYPVHGLIALFVFGIMFMEYGSRFGVGKCDFFKALNNKESQIFVCIGMLAAATIAVFVGLILILALTENRSIGREIFCMLFYVMYCALWILLVGCLFRDKMTFIVWTVALFVIQILVCPVFMDFSQYIKVLRYISYIFPMGIYLRL